MTSYLQPLTSLLTSTTSKYASIRRTLLSDEADGDTEDDSHISRVLRAYYIEKGRPFPSWLPPDPKDKYAAYGQNLAQQYAQPGGPYGPQAQRYGGPASAAAAGGGRRSGGLSDLWDSGPSAAPAQPQSLRAGRQPNAATAAATSVYSPGRSERLAPAGGRPLPSQREGSYQSLRSGRTGGGSLRSTGGSSAASDDGSGPRMSGAPATTQDRLKARLWGGRAGSPAAGSSTSGGGGGY